MTIGPSDRAQEFNTARGRFDSAGRWRARDPRVTRQQKTVAEAAEIDPQVLRDRVIRYNKFGLEGLRDRWGKDRPPKVALKEQADLARIILAGPDPDRDGFSTYTLADLARIGLERFGKSLHPASMRRVVGGLGFSRQKGSPKPSAERGGRAESLQKRAAEKLNEVAETCKGKRLRALFEDGARFE